jgi:CcmD family protein
MTNAPFLFGAYALVGALHAIYLVTLRSRRNKLKEELDLLKEREKGTAE